jgi:SAM-dependent methyltransferase
MAYRSEFYSTMLEIYRFNLGLGFVRAIKGLGGIARYFEYPLCIQWLSCSRGQKVLDVGSSAPTLPLFLASRGVEVTLFDINPKAMQKTRRVALRLGSRIKSPSFVAGDATLMGFPDRTFDAVTCISMIEHPSGDGDSKTMAEIGRMLKPGGMAYVDFPYGQEFAVNRLGTLRPWEEKDGLNRIERRYDLSSIARRLVDPSGLELVLQGYAIGGRLNRLTAFLNNLGTKSGKLSLLWRWSYIVVAYIVARWDKATSQDAEFAYLLLHKKL